MMALDFQTGAQIAASRGLNTVVEGLALAGLSWCGLHCFEGGRLRASGRSAMTRFAVWFATLLVIAGLPLMSFSGSAASFNLRASELKLSSAWALGIFVTWSVIAGGLLVRLGFSLAHVYALRRKCSEMDAESRQALTQMGQAFACGRRVKLLVSDEVRVPTALGFFRPAVVLPAWALQELSADELNGIVLHELAHLRRWDDWTNLAQKLVKALFFFHPAVWWIDSRLALEREIACDDLVLEQTSNAKMYAASLVSVAEKVIAEKMRMGRALALAQNALGRAREVSLRISQILDTRRVRTNRGWRPALAMIGTLAVVAVAATPYTPELVSFQTDRRPAVSAKSHGESLASMVVPAKWTGVDARPYAGNVRRRQSRPVGSNKYTSRASTAAVVSAKATVHRANRKPRFTLAKAPERSMPTATWLVMRSTQSDGVRAVWTLSVWRVTDINGSETFQETILTNSL